MTKQYIKIFLKIVGFVLFLVIMITLIFGLVYVLQYSNEQDDYSNCIELYPLDSCELYKCRAENSNTLSHSNFNMRNYEICKIILDNDMSFDESLDMLNTITEEKI